MTQTQVSTIINIIANPLFFCVINQTALQSSLGGCPAWSAVTHFRTVEWAGCCCHAVGLHPWATGLEKISCRIKPWHLEQETKSHSPWEITVFLFRTPSLVLGGNLQGGIKKHLMHHHHMSHHLSLNVSSEKIPNQVSFQAIEAAWVSASAAAVSSNAN